MACRVMTVITRDGFFYPTLTRIMDSFSCSPQVLFIYLFKNKLAEVPEYAKMQFHMMTLLDVLGKIRFSIPGKNLRYPYPVCKKILYREQITKGVNQTARMLGLANRSHNANR